MTRRELLNGACALAAGAALAEPAAASNSASSGADDGVTSLGALELSAAIRERRLSCVEVMRAYLARIGRLNPRCNALVSLAPEEALLAQAAERDQELSRGVCRGWMHGLPHAVKDLADVRGFVNSQGSPLFRTNVSMQDSVFVERVRQAGAIFIGKTNVPEFGLGSHSYNTVFGTTLNAWNPRRSAGGSSGGAAVGLALHLLPVADGSDMMGSLRNPAAWNNVFGFRPSYGRVPHDRPEYLEQLAVSGPMGRTVPDLARLLATMAGFDARDPMSIAEDPARFAGPLERDVRGLRIGWLGDYGGYLPMEEGVLALCAGSLRTFEAMGCRVDEARVAFDMDRLWRAWRTLRHWAIACSAGPLYADPEKRALLKPEMVWEIENGLALGPAQVFAATAARADWYAAICALFAKHDFLVLPAAQVFPFDAPLHWPQEIAGRRMDTYHRWMEVVIGGTLSGCPVMSLPVGFGRDRLPMGVQLIGPMHRDLEVLQLAAAYELAAGWTSGRFRPALPGSQEHRA